MIVAFRFHPTKGFKLRWDLLIILLAVVNSFTIPLQFALTDLMDNYFVKISDPVVDILFFLDILIMFKTSYLNTQTNEQISDTKKIAKNYIAGRFLIDLMASVPFDTVGNWFAAGGSLVSAKTGTFLSMLKLVRLLRLGRLITFIQTN